MHEEKAAATDEEMWNRYEAILAAHPQLRKFLPARYPRSPKFGITQEAMNRYAAPSAAPDPQQVVSEAAGERTKAYWHHMNLPLSIHAVIHPDQKVSDFGKSVLRALERFCAVLGDLPGARKTLKPLWTNAWNLEDPEFWSVISTVFLALKYQASGSKVNGFGIKIGAGGSDADITITRPDGVVTQVDVEMWHKTKLVGASLVDPAIRLRSRAIEKVDEKFADLPATELGVVAVVCTPRGADFDLLKNTPTLSGLINLSEERPRCFGYVYWLGMVTDGQSWWLDLRDQA